ncbi:MAG TPA: glycosyltransferase family 4 protein [Nitrospiraceae bacterium]|nr:glycosyltransferase family 4 protein [Nitrospiraceae bacterium]
MKVLWLGHNLAYPPKGGALQRNFNLLRQIARKAEVHFLGFDQPITRPPNVSPAQCLEALSRFCASADWVPLNAGPLHSQYLLALRGILKGEAYEFVWLQSSRMAEKLERLVQRVKPDVVHVDALGLAQYLPLVGGVGSVLNHHDVESSKMAVRSRKAQNPLLKTYFAYEAHKLADAESAWCPRFGVNLVVSVEEAHLLDRLTPGLTVRVVPNGVDTDYFTPRRDPGNQTVLFCGSMDMHPNQEAMEYFISRVWPLIVKTQPRAKLQIVGRRPPDWLEAIGETEPAIEVTGFVEDVRPYFRGAAVCVCPILSGGGTRLKILDSLAMGVPVVSTQFAASGLDLEDGKHLLFGETEAQFAEHTVRLLSNPTMRATLASAGAERVNQLYSWSVVGQPLLDAYELAVRKRSH